MKLDELRILVNAYKMKNANGDETQMRAYLLQHGINVESMYQELEMSHRFINTHQDLSDGTGKIQLHSHTFYEMIYCCSNSGVQYLIGNERYRLQRGDIVYISPGIGHKPILTKELAEPYHRYVIWMTEEYMQEVFAMCPESWGKYRNRHGIFRTAGMSENEELEMYFKRGVLEERQKKDGWEAAVCGNTTNLLVHMGRSLQLARREIASAEKPELLDKVITYIEHNLSQKITLSDTAKRFWVSESTISQTFKEKMGVSFYHFVTQRRLIMAKIMILEGEAMEEISEAVGFGDYSTFYRAFKQEYGISPRQYRKLQAAGTE